MQQGGGKMGHRKSGTPGHNSDLIQTARLLNEEAERKKKAQESKKGRTFSSIRELMASEDRRK